MDFIKFSLFNEQITRGNTKQIEILIIKYIFCCSIKIIAQFALLFFQNNNNNLSVDKYYLFICLIVMIILFTFSC